MFKSALNVFKFICVYFDKNTFSFSKDKKYNINALIIISCVDMLIDSKIFTILRS